MKNRLYNPQSTVAGKEMMQKGGSTKRKEKKREQRKRTHHLKRIKRSVSRPSGTYFSPKFGRIDPKLLLCSSQPPIRPQKNDPRRPTKENDWREMKTETLCYVRLMSLPLGGTGGQCSRDRSCCNVTTRPQQLKNLFILYKTRDVF